MIRRTGDKNILKTYWTWSSPMLQYWRTSEDLRKKLSMCAWYSVAVKLRTCRADRWRWLGFSMSVAEGKWREKGRTTWKDCITDDMRKLNLSKENAHDSGLWRCGRGVIENYMRRRHWIFNSRQDQKPHNFPRHSILAPKRDLDRPEHIFNPRFVSNTKKNDRAGLKPNTRSILSSMNIYENIR